MLVGICLGQLCKVGLRRLHVAAAAASASATAAKLLLNLALRPPPPPLHERPEDDELNLHRQELCGVLPLQVHHHRQHAGVAGHAVGQRQQDLVKVELGHCSRLDLSPPPLAVLLSAAAADSTATPAASAATALAATASTTATATAAALAPATGLQHLCGHQRQRLHQVARLNAQQQGRRPQVHHLPPICA